MFTESYNLLLNHRCYSKKRERDPRNYRSTLSSCLEQWFTFTYFCIFYFLLFNKENVILFRTVPTVGNGEAVEKLAESCNLTLIYNSKLAKSFNNARWKTWYNLSLIFAAQNIANMCEKSIMDPPPPTEHCPICVTVDPVVVTQPIPFRRRFKLRKVDWNGYSTELDKPWAYAMKLQSFCRVCECCI